MEQRKVQLLKIIGQNKPSTGNISAPKEAVVAYLPQHLATDGATVMEKLLRHLVKFWNESDIDEQLTIRLLIMKVMPIYELIERV
jgi:ATP-binding cassette subfamily F protein 3